MRKKLFVLLSLASALVFSSCDENKNKAIEVATRFAQAINTGDEATIKGLYPDAVQTSNAVLPKHIDVGDFDVEYVKEFDEYHVKMNNALRQTLVLKLDSSKAFRIIDSGRILQLDSASQALALKVGVPVNDISDIHLADLIVETGPFVYYLNTGKDISESLVVESSTYRFHEYDYDASLYYDVRNNSKSDIKGADYNIELEVYQVSTGEVFKVIEEKGKDIKPGGRAHFETICKNGSDLAISQDLGWNTKFVFNLSVIEQLLKIDGWKGSEYNDFMKIRKAFQK